jgi:hypothetical protein
MKSIARLYDGMGDGKMLAVELFSQKHPPGSNSKMAKIRATI